MVKGWTEMKICSMEIPSVGKQLKGVALKKQYARNLKGNQLHELDQLTAKRMANRPSSNSRVHIVSPTDEVLRLHSNGFLRLAAAVLAASIPRSAQLKSLRNREPS
jgi:hypothetical protein